MAASIQTVPDAELIGIAVQCFNDTSQRLQHTISWVDEAALNNKKRPRDTIGAEI